MAKYRKILIVVEAEQWFKEGDHGAVALIRTENSEREDRLLGATWDCCGLAPYQHGLMSTLEGERRVCPGDWIITKSNGEQYPCKPDIFAETYEAVHYA